MRSSPATLNCLFALTVLLGYSPAHGQSVYWISSPRYPDHRIWRAALDGSSYEEIISEEGFLKDLALEPVSRNLYWVGNQDDHWFIKRARTDGSDQQTVIEITSTIIESAVDPASGSIFFLVGRPLHGVTLYRANLDGTDIQAIVTDDYGKIGVGAVDSRNAKLYWAGSQQGSQFRPEFIVRSNLDGSDRELVLTAEFGEWIRAIVLDPIDRRIYWTAAQDYDVFGVRRADYDGSNAEPLFDVRYPLADNDGGWLQFDPKHRQFYWEAGGHSGPDGMIARSNFDGSTRQGVIARLEHPGPFAVDLGPAVTIDILPGQCPNRLEHRAERSDVIPVAVLGSQTFDPRWVDWTTVTLQRSDGVGQLILPVGDRGGNAAVSFADIGASFDATQCGCMAAGPDGIEDAVVHFTARDLFKAFALDRSRPDDSVGVILRGRLRSGEEIEASDCIAAQIPPPPIASPIVYWNESGRKRIIRADVEGMFQEVAATDLEMRIASFDLEPLSGSVYWTSYLAFNSPPGAIKRARIGSTEAEELIHLPDAVPDGIVLSPTEGKMYWGQHTDDSASIHRADFDGSVAELLVSLPPDTWVSAPLALDERARKLYWSQQGLAEPRADEIRRANLDGTMVELLVHVDGPNIFEIALDLDDGKLYWRSWCRAPDCYLDVHRANLDGSDPETLGDLGCFVGGLALDRNKMIYCGGYTESRNGNLQRTDEGATVVQLIAADLRGINDYGQRPFFPGTIRLDLGPIVSLQMLPRNAPDLRDPARGRADVIAAALIGSAEFDVGNVVRDSLTLSRADGVGGAVAPFTKHGNVAGMAVVDVSAPTRFESCDAPHAAPDGIDDLIVNFRARDVRDALQLGDLERGSTIEVDLTGRLISGVPFKVHNCLTAP